MQREDTMTTEIEKRAETLARLGRVSVLVPDEFLKRLEALAATCAEESTSPTRGAVRA
jgi:hypothetical protein